jgi:hypothetical protein
LDLLEDSIASGNSRITDLLKDLKLEDRVLSDLGYRDVCSHDINWKDVGEKLNIAKKDSHDYLIKALGQ